ncbi:MAG: metal-sensitive transcriptional regulator [Spirochaetes bacterium]|nr:metal-sensitive transcriptional regulator [Spirochaetota bacterium]
MVYKAKDEPSREDLNHRLSRIMGQLEGLKKRVASGESDCVTDMGQIKAIRNALWKFAEAYVEVHMAECVAQKKPMNEMRDNLQSVIQAAFSI